MSKNFKELQVYVRLHDGRRKPKINFQELYKLFPKLTFEADKRFGEYENFGKAYEQKIYDMVVTDEQGHKAYMTYREYGDADESLAYVS